MMAQQDTTMTGTSDQGQDTHPLDGLCLPDLIAGLRAGQERGDLDHTNPLAPPSRRNGADRDAQRMLESELIEECRTYLGQLLLDTLDWVGAQTGQGYTTDSKGRVQANDELFQTALASVDRYRRKIDSTRDTAEWVAEWLKDSLQSLRPRGIETIDNTFNPLTEAATRAILAADRTRKRPVPKEGEGRWIKDDTGRHYYTHRSERSGHIHITLEADEGLSDEEREQLFTRALTEDMDPETADLFLYLCHRIAELPADNSEASAKVREEDIMSALGMSRRDGRTQRMRDDIDRKVKALASMRFTARWLDYKKQRYQTFGESNPARVMEITDLRDGGPGTGERVGYIVTPGHGMRFFMQPGSARFVGKFAPAILRLNPYHEAFAKKIAMFLSFRGDLRHRKAQPVSFTPRQIFDFIGQDPEPTKNVNPGDNVARLEEACHRLQEIGLLLEEPKIEPTTRTRGYYKDWLDTPIEFQMAYFETTTLQAQRKAALPSPRKQRVRSARQRVDQGELFKGGKTESMAGLTGDAIREDPKTIKELRKRLGMSQEQLAKAVGITANAVGNYETGYRRPNQGKADRIAAAFRRRTG